MSRYARSHLTLARSFPRVSGDEPAVKGGFAGALEFSPRERG